MRTIIEDKNLLRILKIKLSTGNQKNIEDIDELDIQDVNFMQKLNIDLKEIIKLKNLKRLSLKFFDITDDVIDALNQLQFIESIEFYMCVFKTTKQINRNIKNLLIYNCNDINIKIISNPIYLENLEIVHSGLVDIKEISIYKKLKLIRISNCNIISIPSLSYFEELEYIYINEVQLMYSFDITKMKNLKLISLNGSEVNNKEEYISQLKNQNSSIEILFRDNNLPIE